jgi:hypothetical protein
MERRDVNSTNVRSVGYDATTETLEVEFHGGGTYRYTGVPESVYEKLMAATSIGRAVREIIVGHYLVEKLGAQT